MLQLNVILLPTVSPLHDHSGSHRLGANQDVVLTARLSLCERYHFGAPRGCAYSDDVLIRSVPVMRVDCRLCRMESCTSRISQHSHPAAMLC